MTLRYFIDFRCAIKSCAIKFPRSSKPRYEERSDPGLIRDTVHPSGEGHLAEREAFMKPMKLRVALVAIAAALVVKPALAAVNVGDELQIQELFPDMSTVVSSNEATYAASPTILVFPDGEATFFLGDRVLLDLTGTDYPAASFNGLKISDLTNANAFAGWALQAGTVNNFGFFSSDGSLFVRLLPQTSTGTILVGTGVPEPSTWSLMLFGFGILGVGWRVRAERVKRSSAWQVG